MTLRLCRSILASALVASGLAAAGSPALAADKVKVGFVSTLSGPSAALGVDIRDAFLLAVKLNGGKLGGLPAEVIVSDDQFKPDVAKGLFEKNIKRDKVDFMPNATQRDSPAFIPFRTIVACGSNGTAWPPPCTSIVGFEKAPSTFASARRRSTKSRAFFDALRSTA